MDIIKIRSEARGSHRDQSNVRVWAQMMRPGAAAYPIDAIQAGIRGVLFSLMNLQVGMR